MKRIFSIAGPCNPRQHYMLPAQRRLSGLKSLVDAG